MKWKAIRNIVGIIILLFVVSGNIVFAADTTPPTAPTIEFIAPKKYASNEWTTEYVSFIVIDGKDAESGVNRSEYRTFYQKESEWTTYATPVWITDSGTTQVEARTIDNEGNISSHSTVTIKIDKLPKGNIVINNGDIATTLTQVTLTIDATDDLGSVAQMQFSNDGENWSEPEAYAATKEWTLESGDGLKTVYAKFCDDSGNWSDIYVYGTGYNGYGQLGINNTTDSKVLAQTWNISGVKQVTAGETHTVALKQDGTVWAWGRNQYGQIGDNTTTDRLIPVQVLGKDGEGEITGITAIFAGNSHTVALREGGTVWAWGRNNYGQLGDDTITNRHVPVQVKGRGGEGELTGVTAISAGGNHTVALNENGTVWAWGYNGCGRLGDGTTTDRLTPVQVLGEGGEGELTGVTAISAGGNHTVVLNENGTVWAWGYNECGQLGDNTTTDRLTPVQVLGEGAKDELTGVTAISAGYGYTVALKQDGTVWAWGDNWYGQLGDNTTTDRHTPVQVLGEGGTGELTGVTAISAGLNHTVALKEDGTVWAWGYNGYGQLGDGTAGVGYDTPVQVKGTGGTGYLTNIEGIDAGYYYTVFKFGILDYILHYDTTPPTAPTIEFTLPSSYTSGSWTNQNVTFTITDGTDEDSGVNCSEYRTLLDDVDWSEWTTYTSAVTITDVGTTSAEARTIDNAENISTVATTTINIDKTAPTGTISINNGDAYTSNISVVLNLSAVDAGGAGLCRMMFSNDNTSWSTAEAYSTSNIWSLQAGGEGTRTVYVKFSDEAGNWSPVYSDTIIYDSTAPGTPVIAFTSPSGYKSAEWTEQNVTFTISNGSDGGSGANYSEYRISFNSGAWGEWTKYISAVTISMEGSTTVEARTVDKADNTGSAVCVIINIDKTAPQAPAIQFTQPGGYIPGTWTNKDVTFTITHGFDGTYSSGADNTEYRMSFNGEPFGVWATYTAPITVTAEGITDFEARTTDNLGHVGAMSSVSISIDKTIPGKPNIKFIAPEEYININK